MSVSKHEIKVTGLGVITPTGAGQHQFTAALKEGKTNFSAITIAYSDQELRFPLGKAADFDFQSSVAAINLDSSVIDKAKRMRNISASTLHGLYCALEAWVDAGLNDADIDVARVAIVSGGSNTQRATLQMTQDKYRGKLQFMNPNYGVNFFDTDVVGVISETLGITGEGHSIGAASASGNMAIVQGYRLISSGEYDVVLVVAPLMDLSVYEYQGFTVMGAMAAIPAEAVPDAVCRPFDNAHGGFVYGQSAGCLILESAIHTARRGKRAYGTIAGYGIGIDANRGPNPSVAGEKNAMLAAIKAAGITPGDINYVNTHGTASPTGDKTEVAAMLAAGLAGVRANSTKSLIGHGLTAAGLVECIASLIQMKGNFLHKSHNLLNPISDEIDWVKDTISITAIDYTLSNSFGFGGMNTSIVIRKN
ncbi:MAG TPA: beta-ketoacyl synthase N-terminal-like domain-containing protein [Chitinophaga sp.]|uniref:beta-ketoacyl synthase N-terminal-like domain-containing protein n=1 Tax=Chitinophaga sp. TaxID=1869181 RepID=UPI002B51B36D|nr:beta-ketoacyl synthase N-terminal-like domain-containing protein [Chitinophaga sp.]HVI45324.1 beta-ketoacyl synthase N-terminal-like domain-containing protein [Chitinophaga sp.]